MFSRLFKQSKQFSNRYPNRSQITINKRWLNIHEYQAQELMRENGIKTAKGGVASNVEEAVEVANSLSTRDVILKAQILAGGRGKGKFSSGLKGGVHSCTPDEVPRFASKMLGHYLFTKQTGEEGRKVDKIYIVERKYIRKEHYFAILLDRESVGPTIIASSQGGVDIEGVAKENPDAITKVPIDPSDGLTDEKANQVAESLGFRHSQAEQAADQMKKLYKLFVEKDATMVEVNPLVETAEGEVICLDAKMRFDVNALYRHPEIAALRDRSQEDPREVEASKFDLNYIGLDGNIGCLVNGAGLAMATMDLIKHRGGEPANFLDIGGGASERQVKEAFRILSEDPNVDAILVNIFGGIMRCDVIAFGIINAYKELNIRIPCVVRLQGTNVEKAKDLMDSSGLRIIFANDLDHAATQAVKVAKIVDMAQEAKLSVSFELPI